MKTKMILLSFFLLWISTNAMAFSQGDSIPPPSVWGDFDNDGLKDIFLFKYKKLILKIITYGKKYGNLIVYIL